MTYPICHLKPQVLTLFLICLDAIPIIMEEVSINSPFTYLLYLTIIMITLRRLPVPLVPHTPILSIYLYVTDPLFLNPIFLSVFYSFTHLMSESNIIIGDFNIVTNQSTNYSNLYSIHCYPPILNVTIFTTHTNMVIHSISSFPMSHLTSFVLTLLALVLLIITLYSLPFNPLNPTIIHSFRKIKIINTH